jgi:hypothetical protein
VGRSDVGPRVTHVLGIVVVNLSGASGNTLYWVLLLGPRQDTLLGIVVGSCEASGNTLTGYCCWFMCLGQHFTGFCWFMWGQHTLLGIVLGYVVPQASNFTGYCCWFMRGLRQHTLLGIVVGYARFWATHFTWQHYRSDVGRLHQNGFKIILFLKTIEKSKCRFPYLLRNCWSE